jgi:predicted PurR-regulated permease PerM
MLVLPTMFSEIYALKNITMSFLGQNINDGSIPEPVLALFNDMSEKYGFAEVLQNSDDTGLLTIIVERAKNVMLGTLSLFGQVMTLSLIMLYLFFMLLDFERISKSWRAYVPRKWRGVVTKLWDDLVYGMNQYFRGQALVALCVGVLFSLGFILIDFPAAIAFGMFIGLLNMVPYLQVVSLFPMALLAMLKASNTGDGFWPIMLSAIAVMCIVQLIQDLFLVPKMVY